MIGPEAAPGQSATCPTPPCIDPGFAAVGGPTQASNYWSASTDSGNTSTAWNAYFGSGILFTVIKTGDVFVRAVRIGSCD